MRDTFRYSPRPNRASDIRWRPWGSDAFEEAVRADRPILLLLTAVWCRFSQHADETTFSDTGIIELLNERMVPVRVDADASPHVQERYIAGGWPTIAFLAPTGEVLWAGVGVEADELRRLAHSVVEAWGQRRDELSGEIERRRKAIEAARGRPGSAGLVRREAADDVLAAARATFDERNGGFGEAPKFLSWPLIELLFVHARTDPEAGAMAERTLDGFLAGEMLDHANGGAFRYALSADWTEPRRDKLLEGQAAVVRAYALGARLRDRDDWARVATDTVEWVDRTLARDDALWSASLVPGAGDGPGTPDERTFVAPCARWIAALADAGGRLGRADWIERAASGLDALLAAFGTDDDLVRHGDHDDDAMPRLLTDAVACAGAALLVARATGRAEPMAHARRLMTAIGKVFWADDGGLWDRTRSPAHDGGLLRYRDRLFEPNAEAARHFLDLVLATGERGHRVRAERTLAVLSPVAGRYGVEGADFALAVHEFFDTPASVVIVGDPGQAAPLRDAALALPRADLRVIVATNGQRMGPLEFRCEREPAAFACGERGRSAPVFEPEALADALAGIT